MKFLSSVVQVAEIRVVSVDVVRRLDSGSTLKVGPTRFSDK